jgi:hypothetical protein
VKMKCLKVCICVVCDKMCINVCLFVGSDMVDWITSIASYHFTRNDAVDFLNTIYTYPQSKTSSQCHIIPVSYSTVALEQFDENSYYRYLEMDHPKMHIDGIINVKVHSRTNTMLNVPPDQEQAYSLMKQAFGAMQVERNRTLPELQSHQIALEVEGLMSQLLTKEYIVDDKYINYLLISTSDIFAQLRQVAEKLRDMDVSVLQNSIEKVSFFINVYNMMAIHALLVRGCANDQDSRIRFSHSDIYYIGRYKLSLYDIYHHILRGTEPPHYKYYLKEYRMNIQFDPRIHFVLCNGCISSAMPHAVTSETLESVLEHASTVFLNREIELFEVEKRIVLHGILREFRQDFCVGSLHSGLGCIMYIAHYLSDAKWEMLWRMLRQCNITEDNLLDYLQRYYIEEDHSPSPETLEPIHYNFSIEYNDYNWNSNRLPKDSKNKSRQSYSLPKVDVPYDEVIVRQDLRNIFAMFCKNEYSLENIMFYEDVQTYMKTSKEHRAQYAKEVFEKFLNPPNSPFEVNVNRALITKVKNMLVEPDRQEWVDNVFERLMQEVSFVLIDSYSRFRSSELYTMMVDLLVTEDSESPDTSLLSKLREQQRQYEEEQQKLRTQKTLQRKQTTMKLMLSTSSKRSSIARELEGDSPFSPSSLVSPTKETTSVASPARETKSKTSSDLPSKIGSSSLNSLQQNEDQQQKEQLQQTTDKDISSGDTSAAPSRGRISLLVASRVSHFENVAN